MDFDDYHRWYYDTKVWQTTTWLGVPCQKSVQDLWSYQEIITELRPTLVVEFGVFSGGSALYYASILDSLGKGEVLAVEWDPGRIRPAVWRHPRIRIMGCSTVDPHVAETVTRMRGDGAVFAVLDSDHSQGHVLRELETLTPVLVPGDYVVVEDSNINGHPVSPNWGPGPYEALEVFLAANPDAYAHDWQREQKFGWTFAPKGWLVRR